MQNASRSKKESVSFSYSKVKASILDILLKRGFIKSFGKKGKKVIKFIDVGLIYDENGMPKIKGVKRISKSSKRIYYKSGQIKSVKNGYGALIISTSKGVMTGSDARKQNLGGEPLFSIW